MSRTKSYTVQLTITQIEVDEDFGLWDKARIEAYIKDALESWVGGMDPDMPEIAVTNISTRLQRK